MSVLYTLPPEDSAGSAEKIMIYPASGQLAEDTKRQEVSIIVAMARDGAIGRGGDLLWHISDDLKRFKQLTKGHAVIMGRKTYESLPKRPLPHRRNIIISRNPEYRADGADVFTSLEEALESCRAEEEVFIIGGATIYALALPLATRLYLTEIDADCEDADTWFPPFDRGEWKNTARSSVFITEEGIRYCFADYRR